MATDRSDRVMTGMFRDRESAERAYECVTSRGYTDKDVSLLMSDETRTRCFRGTRSRKRSSARRRQRVRESGRRRALAWAPPLSGSPRDAIPLVRSLRWPIAAALAGGGAEERSARYRRPGRVRHPGGAREVREQGSARAASFGVTPRTDEDAEYIERGWTNARGEQIYRPGAYEAGRRI
jgi:hypothetical protein